MHHPDTLYKRPNILNKYVCFAQKDTVASPDTSEPLFVESNVKVDKCRNFNWL